MKPVILQTAAMSPLFDSTLAAEFDVRALWTAKDRDAFLAEHGPHVVGMATTGAFGAKAGLIDALPNLKVIACRAVGYDSIDVARAKERGIAISNTPDVLSDCVADVGFGALIAIARQFGAAERFVRRGDWLHGRYPLTTRVHGKRLGIVGLGSIGKAIAKRAAGFDMDIRYHNRREAAGATPRYEPSLTALAQWADFLVVAVTGGPQTRGLISREVIEALGPEGYLVNISRGSVVDEPELVEALVDKRIAGAALDVFDKEPKVPEALLALDNVVLFPHMASGTRETFRAMEDLTLDNLRSFFASGRLVTPVT